MSTNSAAKVASGGRKQRLRLELVEPNMEFQCSADVDVVRTFSGMHLNEKLMRGIFSFGFETPTSVQQRAIVPIIKGRDLILQAGGGTGKTASYVIALLQGLDVKSPETQALVLTASRDDAVQTQKAFLAMGDHMEKMHCLCFVGDTDRHEHVRNLESNLPSHTVVGTPRRIFDLIRRRILRTRSIKVLVLDNADEMLSKEIRGLLYEIYRYLPQSTQVVHIATELPRDLLELCSKFQTEPARVLVKRDDWLREYVKQFVVMVERDEWKFDTLCDLYDMLTITCAIIFCNTQRKSNWLASKMRESNFKISCLQDDMRQKDRDTILKQFRGGETHVMIITDESVRSLGFVPQASLAINYDLPHNRQLYLRRVDRLGRFGRKGVVINFATNDDVRDLRDLGQFYGVQMDEMPMNIGELA